MATFAEIWKTLSKIDCNAHTEKKQGMTYLSWAWAWGIMMEHFPQCEYEFAANDVMFDGTVMVNCTVTIDGNKRSMWLPVMAGGNKPVPNPNAFQVNTARMRCLTKAFGMFGLGHYIYAGEDLPQDDRQKDDKPQQKTGGSAMDACRDAYYAMGEDQQLFLRETADEVIKAFGSMSDAECKAGHDAFVAKRLDNDEKMAIWWMFDSKIRASIKAQQKLEAS